MPIARAIRRAIPILAEHGADREALVRGGLSTNDADKVVHFVPLALGRAALLEGLGMTLPDSYLQMDGDRREEKKLADEPFFAETLKLAKELDPFIAGKVALLSAEVQATNKALKEGVRPEDLVAPLPLIE